MSQMLNKNILSVIMTLNNKFLTLNHGVTNSDYIFTIFHTKKKDLFMKLFKTDKLHELQILMNYIDPSDQNNEAITCAYDNEHLEIVELLKSDPRVTFI